MEGEKRKETKKKMSRQKTTKLIMLRFDCSEKNTLVVETLFCESVLIARNRVRKITKKNNKEKTKRINNFVFYQSDTNCSHNNGEMWKKNTLSKLASF